MILIATEKIWCLSWKIFSGACAVVWVWFSTCKQIGVTSRYMRSGSGALSTRGTNLIDDVIQNVQSHDDLIRHMPWVRQRLSGQRATMQLVLELTNNMSIVLSTERWWTTPFTLIFFLSFSIYCQTLFRVLSAGVLCTLRVAGWKPTSNHIEITVGFFNLHRGWLSLHRGHPVNVPIRRTMHLSSVIPANDTRESVFGHRNFSRRERESNLGPLAPEASA